MFDLLYGEQVICPRWSVSDGLLILSGSEVRPDAHEPEWFKDCIVEASGALDVEGAERDMVKH